MNHFAKCLPLATLLGFCHMTTALAQHDDETRDQLEAIRASIAELRAEVEVLTATIADNRGSDSTEIPPPELNSPVVADSRATVIAEPAPAIVDVVPSCYETRAYVQYRPAYYAPAYYAPDYLFSDYYYPYRAFDYGYRGYGIGGFGIGFGIYPSYGGFYGHHFRHRHAYHRHWH